MLLPLGIRGVLNHGGVIDAESQAKPVLDPLFQPVNAGEAVMNPVNRKNGGLDRITADQLGFHCFGASGIGNDLVIIGQTGPFCTGSRILFRGRRIFQCGFTATVTG